MNPTTAVTINKSKHNSNKTVFTYIIYKKISKWTHNSQQKSSETFEKYISKTYKWKISKGTYNSEQRSFEASLY